MPTAIPPLPPAKQLSFSADNFRAQMPQVVATLAPTLSPTPVAEGYVAIQQTVEKKAIQMSIPCPVTTEELMGASGATLMRSLEQGVAQSLGLADGSVMLTHVGGVAVDKLGNNPTLRRRNADLSLAFDILSPSSEASDVSLLEQNIQAAAASGSMVSYIQDAAFDNGVMTEALFSMDIASATTTQVLVQVQQTMTQPIEYVPTG
jgi:hypothetical protein